LGVALSSLPAKATPASAGSTRRSTIPAGKCSRRPWPHRGAAPRTRNRLPGPVHAHSHARGAPSAARPSRRSRRDGCACRLRPRPVRSG